jgi:hypothetical protein
VHSVCLDLPFAHTAVISLRVWYAIAALRRQWCPRARLLPRGARLVCVPLASAELQGLRAPRRSVYVLFEPCLP